MDNITLRETKKDAEFQLNEMEKKIVSFLRSFMPLTKQQHEEKMTFTTRTDYKQWTGDKSKYVLGACKRE